MSVTKNSAAPQKKSQPRRSAPARTRATQHSANDDDSLIGHSERTPTEELDFEREVRIIARAKKPSTAKVNEQALAALSSKRKGASLPQEVIDVHRAERAMLVAPDLEEAQEAVANVPKVRPPNGGIGTWMSPELFEAMCVAVGKGDSIHKLCERPGMPGREVFFDKCKRDPQAAKRYAAALEVRGELFADQIIEIADESVYAATPEQAAAYRLRVETRKWVVSRLLPKKYGERVTLEGNAENPLVTQLVLGGDALAARIRGGGMKS